MLLSKVNNCFGIDSSTVRTKLGRNCNQSLVLALINSRVRFCFNQNYHDKSVPRLHEHQVFYRGAGMHTQATADRNKLKNTR